VAHPCLASAPASTPTLERRPLVRVVAIDALDAIELADILEYFLERLDVLDEHSLASFLFPEYSTYAIDDLRADLTQLIDLLHTARSTP
jgi:hypothetical protein